MDYILGADLPDHIHVRLYPDTLIAEGQSSDGREWIVTHIFE